MFAKGTPAKHVLLFAVLALTLSQVTSDWLTCYSQPNGVVLPVDADCHVYIYCLDQTPFTIPCPYDMGFSKSAGGCVDYKQSDCVADSTAPSVRNHQNRNNCDNEQRPANKQACVGQPFGELVPYPGDCSKFLVCNCEYPTVKQCGPGTWFDNILKVCNFPHAVHCEDGNGGTTTSKPTTEAETSTESGVWGKDCETPAGMSNDICLNYSNGVLLRYPYNCNAYINCTMGCPVMNYCQPDKVFNNFLKICDTPDTAQCVELPMPTTTTEKTTTEVTTTTPEVTTTTPEVTSTTPEVTTTTTESGEWGQDCQAPNGMSADICLKYSDGILLRYPYDCNAYINCTHGCPVMNYCQPDKVFNDFLKICDTPDTAHCIELPLTTMATTTTEETTTTSPVQTTTELTTTTIPYECIPPLMVEEDICSSLGYSEEYQSYPYNCSAYVICQGDKPCLEYCENGKIFNALLGICDEDVECEELPLPTTTTTATPITTTLPPDVNPDLCQGKEDYTIYPYAGDCSQYLQCLKGEVKLESCPNGWLFNSQLMLCDKASEEVCYAGPTTVTTTETPSTTPSDIYEPCVGQPLGTTFPYKGNCALYYFCRKNGLYYIISCPNNNYYDPQTGDCGPDVSSTACLEEATTTAAPTTVSTTLSPSQKCRNQAAGITYPYEEDCTKYIYCKGNGGYVILNCPYNNYYYPDSGDCGPSDDVNICRKSSQTTTTATTTEITSTVAPTTPKPVLGICGNYSNGELIPYPDNCQKYISCVKPIPVGFYCNNYWYFNEQQQKCVPDSEGTCTELPSNVTTTPATPGDICEGLKEGDWQIYPSNCQFYYECLGDGYYMLKICEENEYFDPLKGQCSAQVGSNYCKQDFNTTTPKPKPQGICSGQDEGAKVAYPHNCTKYIVCNKPIPVGFNCDSGLEFSTEAQSCVTPSQSDCGLSISTPTTTTTTTTTPATTKPYNECTNKPDFTLLPVEADCGMFIICKEDIEHWAFCNEGEYFDLSAGKCLKSANEDSCRPATTTEPTTTTTLDPNLGPCYNKPDGSKIPYPHNCTKYIICQEPLNVGYDCPEGLEFSAHYEECVLPELADCSIKTTTPTPTTTTTEKTTTPAATETCENKPNGATLPYPKDCSKYYMCLNGGKKLVNCMPNSYYDPATGECGNDISPIACQGTINTTPQSPEGVCSDKSNGFTYANKQNCSLYYMCLDQSEVMCLCQNNSYYNPYNGECDSEASDTECKDPLTTIPTEPATTEVSTTTTEPSGDNICCGQKAGTYLPYPGDKTQYVICQYPLPIVNTCPEGSLFDEQTLSCKYSKAFAITKPNCDESNFGRSMVYEGECTKYYFCFGSEAIIMDCSFDWYYDPAMNQCVPQEQYKCPW
ncbi:hypothetical protein FF38_11146 [Lucilia cuprina]|uniref:Chitin-binding type-2 domain-containing protein n=1 Tax=Lucilia cuprina TaxID=7375 RepID=A0A0L0BVV1_LUCCU|nr:hypothetical protein FF38_11146 [Lucilia cuprina]